ncbi:unnamed protein product [Phytophthora lilii]|uniref:Unnamed protein product n=1 Tax=Phytophthora lilii TaxID=2077276 RepID=A0A9W6U666_9STRA|nr:unnamed protein product [Phytophthora lilii]
MHSERQICQAADTVTDNESCDTSHQMGHSGKHQDRDVHTASCYQPEFASSAGIESNNSSYGDDSGVDQSTSGDGDDSSSWQQEVCARDFGHQGKGLHLLVLCEFLTCVSLHDVKVSADIFSSYLLRAAATRSGAELEDVAVSFLTSIFGHSLTQWLQSPAFDGTRPSLTQECAVIQMTVHLFLHAASSGAIEQLIYSASQMGSEATSKEKLRHQFTSFVSRLHDAMEGILHELASKSGDFAVRQPSGLFAGSSK